MKRNRATQIIVAVVCLLAFSASTALASNVDRTISSSSQIKVVLDNKKLSFDQPPIMDNNRVMVPIRTIFEALGYDVTWNQSMQTGIAVNGNNTIRVQVNNAQITYSGGTYWCDVAPKNISGRILVPVRAISESAGCRVNWNGNTQTVTISTDQSTPEMDNTDLFWNSIDGIWVNLNQCGQSGGDVSFPFYDIQSGNITYGVYPGGYDRTGQVINLKATGNNRFTFTLYYPEEIFMMEHFPAEYVDCEVELLGSSSDIYAIRFMNSSYDSTWTKMGNDLETAKVKVKEYLY